MLPLIKAVTVAQYTRWAHSFRFISDKRGKSRSCGSIVTARSHGKLEHRRFILPFASVRNKQYIICSDTSSNSYLSAKVSDGYFNPRYKPHHEFFDWKSRRCVSSDASGTTGSPSPQSTIRCLSKTLSTLEDAQYGVSLLGLFFKLRI